MSELGHRLGEGFDDADPGGAAEPSATRVPSEAVARADLLRSRHAVFGDARPEAVRFAHQLARAIAEKPAPGERVPGGAAVPEAADPRPVRLVEPPRPVGTDTEHAAPTDPGGAFPRVLPVLRDAAFGSAPPAPLPEGTRPPVAPGGLGVVPLPTAPSLVCDRSERVLRVNPAFLRLAGRNLDDPEHGPLGRRLPQLVVGPDADARLVRGDGSLVRVRVIRWELPGDLHAVLLVELGEQTAADLAREADRRWTAELERMARVGTWTYELSTATLTRSETLQELYRSVGIAADGAPGRAGAHGGPVEGEQVALLCQSLRSGARTFDHHVELRLPGDRMLSCRAEVERAADGTPVRLVGVVRDVSTQRQADARVRSSGQRFADLMSLVPAGIGLIDGSGRLVDANPALCALLDVPLERLRGIPATALTAEPDGIEPDRNTQVSGDGLPGWLRRVPPGARHAYRIDALPMLRGDGTRVWCEVGVSVSLSDDGGAFWLVVCTDIGERRRAAELLRSAGTIDELTRLPNRTAALELVDRLLTGAGRDRVALVCGDLDDFARVNSSLGHEAGDDLLITLAGRLQRELPFGCTAARLSGDEFVVICADHGEAGGPDGLARTVADLLRATVTVHGRPVHLTASVGLATPAPTGEVRAADLLRFAEVAMHEAKRQCRGGIRMATDGVVRSATRQLELEAELRAAIADDRLLLEYQPVVGPDGVVLSAEALIRWPHPERGMISPADFLPVAQRGGLLRDMDLWVLRTAAREAASWPAHHERRIAVAVNLAGLLPGDVDFLAAVTAAVTDAGLAWDQLVLELVETSLVALPPHALAAMAELVERGVRFAVDDFGTGYSSLARLKELPAQTVKVDRAFVTGVGTDPADFAVARAVVDMARAMGRTTVAEGVETAEQFHVLRGIGVDAYQGWLFARSLPAEAIRELLASGRLPTPAAAIGA
ncbi:EAL domain-containing protein [Pseudonocardia bannensis]|uniref:EAL domain-containing protein n=1 Tax=Pseudonocardia bannensis TaxID=630973 RepID=A0A848DJ74_9PSEU|nr:EAL domain-containing protein [Pseudonocardia bannensis]NMH92738.1 EAL domain-containing protein [Pseudonocardia bannensis]